MKNNCNNCINTTDHTLNCGGCKNNSNFKPNFEQKVLTQVNSRSELSEAIQELINNNPEQITESDENVCLFLIEFWTLTNKINNFSKN